MGTASVFIACFTVSFIYLFVWLIVREEPTYNLDVEEYNGPYGDQTYCTFKIVNEIYKYYCIKASYDVVTKIIGFTLMNIWTLLWCIVLIIALQFGLKDNLIDKSVIFLLQQSLFMQMWSFNFAGTYFNEKNPPYVYMKTITSVLVSQMFLLFIFVCMRLVIWYKNKNRVVAGVLYISIWCKLLTFLIVNALSAAVLGPLDIFNSYWFIGALGYFGVVTLTLAIVLAAYQNLEIMSNKPVICISFASMIYAVTLLLYFKQCMEDFPYLHDADSFTDTETNRYMNNIISKLRSNFWKRKLLTFVIMLCPLAQTSCASLIDHDLRQWLYTATQKIDEWLAVWLAVWCCRIVGFDDADEDAVVRRPLFPNDDAENTENNRDNNDGSQYGAKNHLPCNDSIVIENNSVDQPERDTHGQDEQQQQQVDDGRQNKDIINETNDNAAEPPQNHANQIDGVCVKDFEIHNAHVCPEDDRADVEGNRHIESTVVAMDSRYYTAPELYIGNIIS